VETDGLTWSRHIIRDQYCAIGTESGMTGNALTWNTGWCGISDDDLPPGNWRLPTKSKLTSIMNLYGDIESFIAEHGFIDNTIPNAATSVWTQSPGATPDTFWVLHLDTGAFEEVNRLTYGTHWIWVVLDP
jgi:hypothetical protein